MKYGDLNTGDIVTTAGVRGVVMAIEKPHPEPRFYAFWLIVWWLVDEERLSFDCLHPEYEMAAGTKVHSDGMVAWRGAARKLGKG